MLKSKIHRATVSDANLEYSGSITIDKKLLEAANIFNHEKVQVVNVTNGARLETYAIVGQENSGQIIINGAAARLCHKNDIIIIISYAFINETEAKDFEPIVVHVDSNNKLIDAQVYTQAIDAC